MRDLQIVLGEVKNLEDLRGDVPTYFYFGDISSRNFVKVQKDLMGISEHGKEIDIVLQSLGGQTEYAYRLIRTFRKKYDTVNVIVPSWAKSAATLFAFGASRLILHEYGELGPIDVQVKKDIETNLEGEWSSAVIVQASLSEIETRSKEGISVLFKMLRNKENTEIQKIGRTQLAEMILEYSAKFYQPLLQKVDVPELGKMARYLNESKLYAKRILTQYGTNIAEDKIDKLINFLTYDCPDHGYVVDYDLLHPHLPYVKKADELPFSIEYNKALEKLSVHLMQVPDDDNVIGFLKDLMPKPQSTPIKSTNGQIQ